MQKLSSLEEFNQILTNASTNNRLVVVNFSAKWCGPCKRIAPQLEKLAQLYSNNGKAEFYKVNLEQGEKLVKKYEIRAVPTFLFFKENTLRARRQGADLMAVRKTMQELAG